MVRNKLARAVSALTLTLGVTASGIIWDSVGTQSAPTTASGIVWDSVGHHGGSAATDDGNHWG
ncbi:hypothetical protein [Humibacillus sp. DSM 29435]|uniref:hypothetical protein n=1 Tax=Humibacillus sp. DSM 29435 TaxID=1869167 RepID=UPI00111318E5|nr:hypothetical protein [Humibacillus sp. DSM 29435]